MQFSDFIKILGRGKRGAKELTQEQAYIAMSMLLNGEATGEQRGAFLMLLRVREETVPELTGFVQACQEHINKELSGFTVDLDLGCYAGKRRHLPWYLLSVACLVEQGHKVFLHGTTEPHSKRLYTCSVLPNLGLATVNSVQEAKLQLAAKGVTYLDIAHIHAGLDEILKLREFFGLRSCANTLARMLNPSQAPYCVQGVYHEHVDEKHGGVNSYFEKVNSLCFRGDGGDPEISPDKDTILHFSRNGRHEPMTYEMPIDGWSMKDKMDDTQVMLDMWQGIKSHQYGESAVLSTLSAYLMLLKGVTQTESLKLASDYWHSRDKSSLPF